MTTDSFYTDIQIPLNLEAEENGYEFVNAVTVQDKFAEATLINAKISRELELANRVLADVDFKIEQVKRRIVKLRRKILSENYGKVTKSAGAEVLDAFIVAHATPTQSAALDDLEAEESELWELHRAAKVKVDEVKNRMFTFQRTMDYLTEWLNYDKFQTRLHQDAKKGAGW